MAKKYIDVMDTTFGDSLSSLYRCEIKSDDIITSVEAAKDAGISHFEFINASHFKSIVVNERKNPFEFMSQFRKAAGEEANLQVSAHSINTFLDEVATYDLITLFTKLMAQNQATTIRHFDPLNDIRNLDFISYEVGSNYLMNEVTICMMEAPTCCVGLYDVDFYKKKITELLDSAIGFDSICFMDVNGSTSPTKVFEIIKMARELLGDDVHIRFNTRDSASIGVTSYLAALEAGVDGIDLSCAPISGFSSMPDILPLLYATKDLDFNLDNLEIKKIQEYQRFLKNQMAEYWPLTKKVDTHLMLQASSVLGDKLLDKLYTLKKSGNSAILDSLVDKMSDVIDKGGCAASIDVASKYYWQQAILNVKYGDYKKINLDYAKMALGYFGRTPIAPDPNLLDKISLATTMELSYQDPLERESESATKSLDYFKNLLKSEALDVCDENIYIVAVCGKDSYDYLRNDTILKMKKRLEKSKGLTPQESSKESENRRFIQDGLEIISKYDGFIDELNISIGDTIDMGEIVAVIKSNDLEISVMSPFSGVVVSSVSEGDEIHKGDVIATIASND